MEHTDPEPDYEANLSLAVPRQIGISNLTAIAAGFQASIGLKDDGTVWQWGRALVWNATLKQGEWQDYEPFQVEGLSNIAAIAYYQSTGLALDNNGNVWGWGGLAQGILCDGTFHDDFTDRKAPFKIEGIGNVKKIAVGDSFSLFLKKDGTLWGCGDNLFIRLWN